MNQNTDMLHGPLTKKLLFFTLPIALSSMLQQLFNAADTAVVGLFTNANALAAVGTNTEIIALIVTVSSGLSIGSNVLIAKLIGKGKTKEIPTAIKASLLLSVLIGLAGLALGQIAAAPLLNLIRTPAIIRQDALLYLRIYMLGYPFLLLYDFGSAVLRAEGDSHYPFHALVISGLVNVGLNLFFVIVCHMGVMGVAAATDLSGILSALLVLQRLVAQNPSLRIRAVFHGIRTERIFRRKISTLDPAWQTSAALAQRFYAPEIALEILKVGLPSALQGAVFCFANIFVQASVNSFGETAISGSTIAMNFEYLTYYIITAFGQTATTFTGQNHAAGQKKRCGKIFRLCLALSTICSCVPIFIIVFYRNFFAGLFTPNDAVIESASLRILCILLFEPLCNLYEIPAGVLRGSGHALYPALSTMIGTCAFRILWICTVFRLHPTLSMLYHAFPLSWCVTIILVNCGFFLITFLNGQDHANTMPTL